MNLKKLVFLLTLVSLLTLSGCSNMDNAYNKAAEKSFQVNVLEGTAALGMLKMMAPEITPNPRLGDTVQYVLEKNQDELYSKLQKGEVEIAAVPTEMAARLFNENNMYKLAAVNTKGFIYVLTNNTQLLSWNSLKGCELNLAVEGSVEDIIFRYLTAKNGLDPYKDITIKYAGSQEALYKMTIDGSSKITVLSEPWASMAAKNSGNKIMLNLQEEWTRINGGEYPMVQTSVVVKKEAASAKAEPLDLFLKDYADSLSWVNKNPLEAARLLDNHTVGVSKDLAQETIKRSNFVYISAKDAEAAVEKYLQVLLESSPEIIGGKLPGKDFYSIGN